MSNIKFIRQGAHRHSKLGLRRKKLQVWRKPTGMHSKLRQNRKGHKALPSPGFKSPKKELGRINGQFPVLVYNTKDLKNISKDSVAILAKVGAKKKFEIIKLAQEMKIKILNLVKEKKK